jgi:hypothetical protein
MVRKYLGYNQIIEGNIAYCPLNINFICKHELQDEYTHLPVGEVGDLSLMLVSTEWEDRLGFLHSTKFLCQQDGKRDLDSYTEQNSCFNRIGRRIWIPTQQQILLSTGWEDGFGFLTQHKILYQQDGKTDLDSYTKIL